MRNANILKNKRLAGIDYGLARVGIAVTDELHISITPKAVLLRQENDFWLKLKELLEVEKIAGIVVGMPFYENNSESKIVNEINSFAEKLKKIVDIPIFFQDESYSSIQAVETMLQIGKKKKKRAEKGAKDKIAAAIILQNFLTSIEY
jgi:putative Holliday junction resolvase